MSQYIDPGAKAFTRQGIYLVGEAVTFQRAVGQPPNVTLVGVTTITAKVMSYAPDTTQQAATGYSASQIGNVTIGDRTIFAMVDDLASGGFPLPVQKGDQVLLNDPIVGTGERLVVVQVDMAKRGFAGCVEMKVIGVDLMVEIRMLVDETKLTARLDKMIPDVHEALARAVGPLASEIASDARDLAQAHIHYVGTRPGQYLASIYGGTYDKGNRLGGFVRSGDPLAHLLEHGANIPAHDILPSVADVLAFDGDAGKIFSKIAHHPGAAVPPHPAIEPAFQAAKGKIEDALTKAVKGAV